MSTVMKVKSCPLTAEEWGNAVVKKGCESINHSFLYHCVMNTWRNETVEVCAPWRNIVGKRRIVINLLLLFYICYLWLTDIYANFQFCKNDISKGHICPEYNVGGCRIQRSKEPCIACPVSYNSSKSYLCK